MVIIGLVGILVLAVRVRILLPQPLTNPTTSRPFSTTHLYERCAFFVRAMEKKTKIMNRSEVLEVLTRVKPDLARRFGVVQLLLFGSTVRNEAKPDSDVDIVVSFDGPATSRRYFGVQFYLEDALGCPVDLVTQKALRQELRPFIEREAVSV